MARKRPRASQVKSVVIDRVTSFGRPSTESYWCSAPGFRANDVQVVRYVVTVERLDEGPEVLGERLLALWRSANALWQRGAIREEARRLRVPQSLFADEEFGGNVGKGRKP